MDLNIYFNIDCAKAKLLKKAINVIIKSRYYFSRKILLKHNSLLLFFKEELCYNKYRRRSRHLYLRSKYRKIWAARRKSEYLFSQRYKIACLKCEFAQFYNASRLRKSEAFEESNRRYNKISLLNFKENFIET